jgi:hypothetical protein
MKHMSAEAVESTILHPSCHLPQICRSACHMRRGFWRAVWSLILARDWLALAVIIPGCVSEV